MSIDPRVIFIGISIGIIISVCIIRFATRFLYKALAIYFICSASMLLMAIAFPSQPTSEPTIVYENHQLTSEQLSQDLIDQLKEENPGKDIWVEVHFQ